MQKFNSKKIGSETILVVYPLAVSDQYVFSTTVVLHPEMNDQSLHAQMNKTEQRKLNKVTLFSKWNIYMTI